MPLISIPETDTLLITVSKQPTPTHTDTHISRTFAGEYSQETGQR